MTHCSRTSHIDPRCAVGVTRAGRSVGRPAKPPPARRHAICRESWNGSASGGQDCAALDVDGTLVDSSISTLPPGARCSSGSASRSLRGGFTAASAWAGTCSSTPCCGIRPLRDGRVPRISAPAARQRRSPGTRADQGAAGARDLLDALSTACVPWALATSGRRKDAGPALEASLSVPMRRVTGEDVRHAKPEPDLFVAAAERLGVPIQTSVVVGDSVWDFAAAARVSARGVGCCRGLWRRRAPAGGGVAHLRRPADLLQHLDELGLAVARR